MDKPDNIFPLKLSDFENYAFCDDTQTHPMVIVLRISFEGALQEDVFQCALTKTLKDNPLLTAVIDHSRWQSKWRQSEQTLPTFETIHYDSEYPPTDCVQRHLDLTRSPGVEFELRLCANRGSLVAYFHHACVDGLGAIQFTGDLFAGYGQQTATCDDERPAIRTIDPRALMQRGAKRRSGQTNAPLLHTFKETFRLLACRSYRLVGGRPVPEPVAGEQESNILHSRLLPRAALKQLKKIVYEKGVTLNDLCLMVFLQQIDQWSASDPKGKQNDLFRILMPVSMRNPDHDGMSAANVVSYVFHNFSREHVRSAETLLTAIHETSQQMLNRNEAVAMLYGFALTRRIPGLFRLSKWLQPDYASAAVTSVGEVKRIFGNRFPMKRGRAVAGDVVIQGIDGIAPVRKNTNLTLAYGTYAGELILHLNRNTQVFSAGDAEDFLNQLTAQLHFIARTGKLDCEEREGKGDLRNLDIAMEELSDNTDSTSANLTDQAAIF